MSSHFSLAHFSVILSGPRRRPARPPFAHDRDAQAGQPARGCCRMVSLAAPSHALLVPSHALLAPWPPPSPMTIPPLCRALTRYATGGKVSEESVKIHDYFMTKHAQDCVHFLVDTTPGKDRVAVSALMRWVECGGRLLLATALKERDALFTITPPSLHAHSPPSTYCPFLLLTTNQLQHGSAGPHDGQAFHSHRVSGASSRARARGT